MPPIPDRDALTARIVALRERGLFVADADDPALLRNRPDPEATTRVQALRERGLFIADLDDPTIVADTRPATITENPELEAPLEEGAEDVVLAETGEAMLLVVGEDRPTELALPVPRPATPERLAALRERGVFLGDVFPDLITTAAWPAADDEAEDEDEGWRDDDDYDDDYDDDTIATPAATDPTGCPCQGRGWIRDHDRIRVCPQCQGRGLEHGAFQVTDDDEADEEPLVMNWDMDRLLSAVIAQHGTGVEIASGARPQLVSGPHGYSNAMGELKGWGLFDEFAQTRMISCLLPEQRLELDQNSRSTCLWDAADIDFTLIFSRRDGQLHLSAYLA